MKNAQELLKQAQQAYQQNNLEQALKDTQAALALESSRPQIYFVLGNIQRDLKEIEKARSAYQKALELAPNFTPALNHLALLEANCKNYDIAADLFLRLKNLLPNQWEPLMSLGQIYELIPERSKAQNVYTKVLELYPESLQAHLRLGWLNKEERFLAKAKQHYLEALKLAPQKADIYFDLFNVYYLEGDFNSAFKTLEQILAIDPNHHHALIFKAQLLNRKGEYQEAYRFSEQLLDRFFSGGLINDFAKASQKIGQEKKAIEKLTPLKNLIQDRPTLSRLHFSLGYLWEQLKTYDTAFKHYQAANEYQDRHFDRSAHLDFITRIKNVFTPELFTKHADTHLTASQEIVFIISMPRSGSSLTEQILASHPDIRALGEIARLKAMINNLPQTKTDYPELVSSWATSQYKALNDTYFQPFHPISHRYLSVKSMSTYLHLGLIALIFPQAKIIHVVRNPLDTCISCYFHYFKEHDYIYSLEDLGFYYRHYQNLMKHWQAILPLNIYELQYEQLVASPQTEIENMLTYLDLPWHPQCLDFHKLSRHTITSSYAQVKQPLNSRSIHRYKNYEKYLAPLKKALQNPA